MIKNHRDETNAPIDWNPGEGYADEKRMFQGIPSMERASNGRLWAAWYGGGIWEGKDNYVMLVTSADDGRTWSKLKLVIDPDEKEPVRASEPCLWHDPEGRLWLMWGEYPRGLRGAESSNWCITTTESGQEVPKWSGMRRISKGVTFNKPVVLSSGRWIFPAGIWNLEKVSRVVISDDKGKSFGVGGQIFIPQGREFDEYMVVEKQDKTLWLLTRTEYGIGECFSTDGGETWSTVTPSKISHTVSRFFLKRLKSGRLLLVKHGEVDQRTEKRSQLMAFLSEDDGETWSKGLQLDEREGVSYPDGIQAPDGRIYIIYDYRRTTEKEILMAVFTEKDILEGKPVSEEARFRVLVNKAAGINPEPR